MVPGLQFLTTRRVSFCRRTEKPMNQAFVTRSRNAAANTLIIVKILTV